MGRALGIIFAALVVGAAAVVWLGHGDVLTAKAPVSAESAPTGVASVPAPGEPVEVQTGPLPRRASVPSEPSGDLPPPAVLNEQTLVNTTWGRDDFELEFAADGVLRIGGRERASWQVIGERIRLYDERGEEHWLEIANGRITWNGEEVGWVK